MADTYARYRHICGTAAEWAVSDIVIAEGEIAVELPSAPGAKPRVKAGDGTRRFSQLPYIDGMDQAALTAILNNYLLKSDGVSTAALTTALNAETARADGAYVKLSGATMTGQLTLPGAGTGKQAATVDQVTAETARAEGAYVKLSGSAMTGQLTLPGAGTGTQAATVDQVTAETTRAEGAYVKLSGSTMTGQLTLLGTGTGKQAASVDQIKAAIDATGTTTGGVGKNDQLVRTDANGVIDTSLINIPGVMKIKGAQDPTAAPPTVPAPAIGDAYIASVTGVANAAFGPGVTGTVSSGDMLIYIGGTQKWDVVAAHADLDAYVKKTGDTLSGDLTLNNGTANGVLYLNGSKVVTSGSALTYNGTNLSLDAAGAGPSYLEVSQRSRFGYDGTNVFISDAGTGKDIVFTRISEQMRLTSTGLGIGTSSPASKLEVTGDIRLSGGDPALIGVPSSTAFYIDNRSTGKPIIFRTSVSAEADVEVITISSSGNLIQSAPSTAPSLTANGQMVFNLTSDTNLRVSVRGSDGVTRTANITLA